MKTGHSDRFLPPLCQTLEPRRLLAAPWADTARLVGQDTAASHFRKTTGKGQTIAIIDTGVDYNHPALGGAWGKRVIGGYDFVSSDADPMDETGHGTSVAGILVGKSFTFGNRRYQGIAPGAKLVALRVEDNSGVVPNSRIEAALQWILKNRRRFGITGVNMSFGEGAYGKEVSLAPYSDELAKLRKANVFLAAAAGNEGAANGGIDYPGADPSVISVGSVNSKDVISSFSSRGRTLDLLAPGEDVAAPSYDPFKRRHVYVKGSGTSFSTPMVVGAAALLRQMNPKLNPADILRVFKASSTPNRDGDVEPNGTDLTFARIDINRALSQASKSKPKSRARRAAVQTRPRVIEPAPNPHQSSASAASVFSTTTVIQAGEGVWNQPGAAVWGGGGASVG